MQAVEVSQSNAGSTSVTAGQTRPAASFSFCLTRRHTTVVPNIRGSEYNKQVSTSDIVNYCQGSAYCH